MMRLLTVSMVMGSLSMIPVSATAQTVQFDSSGVVKSSWDTAPTAIGVYCSINDVRLLARSSDDCDRAGGEATHTLNVVATEARQ